MKHWTERSVGDFLYRITADFVAQLETKIQAESLNKSDLAQKLGVSKGRVSQILNNPGNLSLKTIIKFARALGMKIAIVAYDDGDQGNERGPINADIFRVCWENSGKPADFWSLPKSPGVANTVTLFAASDIEVPLVMFATPRGSFLQGWLPNPATSEYEVQCEGCEIVELKQDQMNLSLAKLAFKTQVVLRKHRVRTGEPWTGCDAATMSRAHYLPGSDQDSGQTYY